MSNPNKLVSTSLVLLDYQTTIDKVIFHEFKGFNKVTKTEKGVEMEYRILSHIRTIGDRRYTTRKRWSMDGTNNCEETIETNMAPEEIEDFKREWDATKEMSSLFYEEV